MKKSLLSILIIVLFVMSVSTTVPVFADSPQILRNPGFEEDVDYWVSAVTATLVALKSFEGVTPQAGDNFVYTDNRYGYADAPMQHIQNQMNFYKQGTYQIKAYMKLPSGSSASTAKARIVIQTVSTDKKSGGAQFPGMNWYTSDETIINKTSWTLLQANVDIQWSETLESCEFYFLTLQGDPVTNICIDSTSMVKVGYNGPAYSFPTPTPPKNSPTPTTPPALTSSPVSSSAPTTSSRFVYSRSYSSDSSTPDSTTSPSSIDSASDSGNSVNSSQGSSSLSSETGSVAGVSETTSLSTADSAVSAVASDIKNIADSPDNKAKKVSPVIVGVAIFIILAAAALLIMNLINKKKTGNNNG